VRLFERFRNRGSTAEDALQSTFLAAIERAAADPPLEPMPPNSSPRPPLATAVAPCSPQPAPLARPTFPGAPWGTDFSPSSMCLSTRDAGSCPTQAGTRISASSVCSRDPRVAPPVPRSQMATSIAKRGCSPSSAELELGPVRRRSAAVHVEAEDRELDVEARE